ncbi:MAG: Gfo/Idh/MocA family protein [Candidatus Poribacteria bacterium]
MSEKVGIGIIGCGGMGRHHARNLANIPEVGVRAYADIRLEAAEAIKNESGGDFCTTEPHELLADDRIDVVLICTHHHLHKPYAVAAAQAGKHIFVEKPLALTIEECQEIERAVETADVKLMVGFQARFSPFINKLKEVIPNPLVTFGQLVDPKWGDQSWANDPIEGGGNVLSQGCHLFDMMYWFNESEPVTIHAEGGNFTHPNIPEITDSVVATIQYANGAVGSLVVGDFGAPALAGKSFYELFGGDKTGTLYGYYSEPAIKFWGADVEEFTMADLPEAERNSSAAHGYVGEMQALIDWVAEDIDPVMAAKPKDGTRATTLGVKAIESIKTGTPQNIP